MANAWNSVPFHLFVAYLVYSLDILKPFRLNSESSFSTMTRISQKQKPCVASRNWWLIYVRELKLLSSLPISITPDTSLRELFHSREALDAFAAV